jgi:hypothetical protein
LSHPAFTGISRAHLADLIEELSGPWVPQAARSAPHHRRGRKRKRQAGAGPKHELLFTDRVVVTAEHKQWRPLQRYVGRREHHAQTHRAIAGSVSDRAAARPTRRQTNAELVPASPAAC